MSQRCFFTTAARNSIGRTMKVFVFDFDDTLAHTEGTIGIAHFEHGESTDPIEWLEDIGLNRSYIVFAKKYPHCNAAYINTAGFREYTKIIRSGNIGTTPREIGQETGVGTEDVLDFSHVNDLEGATAIPGIMEIARKASTGDNIVGVVTGRRGGGTVMCLDGNERPVNTRRDIQGFLARHGVLVEMADIYGVGHMPGPVSANKTNVILDKFITKYKPDELVFYDDDDDNLQAVSALSSHNVKVVDTKVVKETANPWISSLVERASQRRLNRGNWSRGRLLAMGGRA